MDEPAYVEWDERERGETDRELEKGGERLDKVEWVFSLNVLSEKKFSHST